MREYKESGTAANQVAKYGMLIALACVCSVVENMIPISIGVPGVKLGLANLVTIVSLYTLSLRGTIMIAAVRVLLTSLMFGGMSMWLYSMAGCVLSLICMVTAKKAKAFGMLGVSILGGVGHNIGQMLVAMLVMESVQIGYYFAVLLAAGIAAGCAVGILAAIVLKRIAFLR
ncbi:MAG: Gx transporter family protein [bacterium]|nr:Gx transporter family protein [bacterium]